MPTEFDLAELSHMAHHAKLSMRMYLHMHPQATAGELDTLVTATVGRGRPEEMVLAAQITAATVMAMEDLGLKVPPNDTVLTEAIMDVIWADRNAAHPNQRTIARRAWVLWLEYTKRGLKK